MDQRGGGVVHRLPGGQRAYGDCAGHVRQRLAADDRRLRGAQRDYRGHPRLRRPLGKDIVLKWPNDIFVDGKKLGGVLAEMVPLAATPIADGATGTTDVAAATERVGIVFGIGLNLTVPEDHLPTDKATSLQLVAHGLPDSMALRDMIAAHLVDGLRSRLADFEADPHREATRAMEEMRPVCWTLGKPCEAHFVDGTTLRGTALELNPDASLTIRDDNGNLHTVRTADVGVLPQ